MYVLYKENTKYKIIKKVMDICTHKVILLQIYSYIKIKQDIQLNLPSEMFEKNLEY